MQQDFLNSSNREKALTFFNNLLRYYNLNHLYDGESIYHEVFLKYRKFCDSGGEIENIEGWMMAAGKYQVLSYVKQDIKKRKLLNDIITTSGSVDKSIKNFSLLHQVLMKLKQEKPDYYRLIFLYYFREYSWSKIAASELKKPIYQVSKKELCKYRKRGSRAIKRLRKNYLKLLEK